MKPKPPTPGSEALWMVLAVVSLAFLAPAPAAERQVLPGHVPTGVTKLSLQPVGRLPGTNRLNLAIGLPLRNREALTRLLQQIYDPASTHYRHYLTPEQFAERFGPKEQDYAAVTAFAKANGLTVTTTHPNRTILDVRGAVANIERGFHLTMHFYQHPTEPRTFYAPDVEPSLDLDVAVLHIGGLNNYTRPHPNLKPAPLKKRNATPNLGSGPDGTYWGYDFRAAYAPGVTLTGSGQSVGLVQFDGYYARDIQQYRFKTQLPNVPLTKVLLDGFDGTPGTDNFEVAADIEMVISMAPRLSSVIVYEGGPNGIPQDILNRMATDNLAKQLSCSWSFMDQATNSSLDQVFLQFAAQGQSFFEASGDDGAFAGPVDPPGDNPYITIVGGTTLSTTDGGAWASETTWHWAEALGPGASGGGISTSYAIPSWQTNLDLLTNQGSPALRNFPDIAMVADNVWVIYNNGESNSMGGTSLAAPLWAAFTALANEQAALRGSPPVGFLNPALYAIGTGPGYTNCFHDITTGNNTNASSPDKFYAVPGYDLCTGWGTPMGQPLIDALAPTPPPPPPHPPEAILSYTIYPSVLPVGYALGGAGFAFVPRLAMDVTALGFFGGNELDYEPYEVSLRDTNGLPLASVFVTTNSPLSNWTRYELIATISLNAGELYYMWSFATNSGMKMWVGFVIATNDPANGSFSVSSDIDYLAAAYGTNEAGLFPPSLYTNALLVGPNFQYSIRPAIMLGGLLVSNGQARIVFTATNSAATSFTLLGASNLMGPWMTNPEAVLITNQPGVSYTFTAPATVPSQFFRVQTP